MPRRLDYTDLRILEAVGVHSPRNISLVARELQLPTEMVRRRIKRMMSKNLLWFHANIYHTNLGLRKAVVILDAVPGYEKFLPACLKTNDFWIYITNCYGRFEGCVGIFTIPEEHCSDFEKFIEEFRNLGLATNTHIFWSTCFQKNNPTTNWFDSKTSEWNFPWEEWIKEIPAAEPQLPFTLKDPKEFAQKGDLFDVLILKEMEKDAAISFTDIGKKIGLTKAGVRYHYQEHIIKLELLEGFEIELIPFSKTTSDFYFFSFMFSDTDRMARFALSLLNKPFVFILGKILEQPGIISQLYLPKEEFLHFKDCLSLLVRKGWLKTYDYVIQHTDEWSRQTISYEYFKDEKWVYEHERHLSSLRNTVVEIDSREFPKVS